MTAAESCENGTAAQAKCGLIDIIVQKIWPVKWNINVCRSVWGEGRGC